MLKNKIVEKEEDSDNSIFESHTDSGGIENEKGSVIGVCDKKEFTIRSDYEDKTNYREIENDYIHLGGSSNSNSGNKGEDGVMLSLQEENDIMIDMNTKVKYM